MGTWMRSPRIIESNTEPAGESAASSSASEEPSAPGTTEELVSCETPANCSEGSHNLPRNESKNSKLNSPALDFLNYLYTTGLHENYSDLTTALRIYLTLPVSVASNERSFSKLKIIKHYLRNLTKQDHLSNLAVINTEHEKASKISYDDVIKTFAAKKRKIKLK
ncbi:hypothetical protein AVEN_24872-1 [Araneus ventricosus]|uniref:HAT C-terminal dimerisation domain-containing protein n=1 Tax=Araneus ventricosus TaxID=182803 RepID=A0A4Y2JP38_ARAVE|nr:hypothetical protein AVEN_24872-1 [Araneus ventricosus]